MSNLQKDHKSSTKNCLILSTLILYVFSQPFLIYVYTHCHLSSHLRTSCSCDASLPLNITVFTSLKQGNSIIVHSYWPPNENINNDTTLPSNPQTTFKFQQFPQQCFFFLRDLETHTAFSRHDSGFVQSRTIPQCFPEDLDNLILNMSSNDVFSLTPLRPCILGKNSIKITLCPSLFIIMEAQKLSHPTDSDVNLITWSGSCVLGITISPFVIYQFSVRRNSDSVLLSCNLPNLQPALAFIDDFLLNQP